MRIFMEIMAEAVRRLAGPGAAGNAAYEVERANRSALELDAQLGLMLGHHTRRAA
ncbi:MAG TPA: hypothetical protein VMV14_04080 [Acidimicrobiales bacterium]|nr:hypothetical protein [Acidimicrobiales bacterium]